MKRNARGRYEVISRWTIWLDTKNGTDFFKTSSNYGIFEFIFGQIFLVLRVWHRLCDKWSKRNFPREEARSGTLHAWPLLMLLSSSMSEPYHLASAPLVRRSVVLTWCKFEHQVWTLTLTQIINPSKSFSIWMIRFAHHITFPYNSFHRLEFAVTLSLSNDVAQNLCVLPCSCHGAFHMKQLSRKSKSSQIVACQFRGAAVANWEQTGLFIAIVNQHNCYQLECELCKNSHAGDYRGDHSAVIRQYLYLARNQYYFFS